MKLGIRFADKIVGLFIVLAVGIVIFVIILIGSNQRWFSRDYSFNTYFESATGLSQNMPIQYKGFTLGRVKTIHLADDDRVEVRFIIFDTYISRVKRGSLVEVVASPISALGGNQFLFYPGKGVQLTEGEMIPAVDTPEAQRLINAKLTNLPERGDSISKLINDVGATVATLNALISDVQEAFAGTDRTSLGRTMGGVEAAMTDLQELPRGIEDALDGLMAQLDPILSNFGDLSGKLSDPEGSIGRILDADGDMYRELVKSLESLAGTLRNLEQTSDILPTKLPVILDLINTLDGVANTVNNILPETKRKETTTGGAYTRDMEF